jgi:hypothetical protein
MNEAYCEPSMFRFLEKPQERLLSPRESLTRGYIDIFVWYTRNAVAQVTAFWSMKSAARIIDAK